METLGVGCVMDSIKAHDGGVFALYADAQGVVSGGADGTIKIWYAASDWLAARPDPDSSMVMIVAACLAMAVCVFLCV